MCFLLVHNIAGTVCASVCMHTLLWVLCVCGGGERTHLRVCMCWTTGEDLWGSHDYPLWCQGLLNERSLALTLSNKLIWKGASSRTGQGSGFCVVRERDNENSSWFTTYTRKISWFLLDFWSKSVVVYLTQHPFHQSGCWMAVNSEHRAYPPLEDKDSFSSRLNKKTSPKNSQNVTRK